jgi:N-acetylmuramoyl-L-alanine amidase
LWRCTLRRGCMMEEDVWAKRAASVARYGRADVHIDPSHGGREAGAHRGGTGTL